MWIDDLDDSADPAADLAAHAAPDRCRTGLPLGVAGGDSGSDRSASQRGGRRGSAVKLLLDGMYSARLGKALRAVEIESRTVFDLRLAGASDAGVFAGALTSELAVLTENVADFTRLAAEHSAAGAHHRGVLIALFSRFSCQPVDTGSLVAAVRAVADEHLADRVVYLHPPRT